MEMSWLVNLTDQKERIILSGTAGIQAWNGVWEALEPLGCALWGIFQRKECVPARSSFTLWNQRLREKAMYFFVCDLVWYAYAPPGGHHTDEPCP